MATTTFLTTAALQEWVRAHVYWKPSGSNECSCEGHPAQALMTLPGATAPSAPAPAGGRFQWCCAPSAQRGPPAVPAILVSLGPELGEEEASGYLSAINAGRCWRPLAPGVLLTGRALQHSCLSSGKGHDSERGQGQPCWPRRANGAAARRRFVPGRNPQ